MGTLAGRKIVFAMGGGIAAYKACLAVRLLVNEGAEVRVAMTEAATRFVGPLTLQALTQRPVLTDVLDAAQEGRYGHLDVARGAELLVVAPATADLVGRLRAGLGDDAVTTVALACRCPVLLAPAMNTAMWEHELVQANVAALLATGRHHLVGPASGVLADGDVGPGRLAEPDELLEAARGLLAPKDLAGRRVVITAGPTREHLDPVRFISNPSTGRMGFALAAAARDRGARVTLVAGPTELSPPAGVEVVRITSADELLAAALPAAKAADAFLSVAAVADQRPAKRAAQKAKKREGAERLELVRTPDVLLAVSQAVHRARRRPVLVGFAAETERLLDHGAEKLARKKLDLLVANDVSEPGSGFGAATNRVTILAPGVAPETLPRLAKREVAEAILDRVAKLLARRPVRG